MNDHLTEPVIKKNRPKTPDLGYTPQMIWLERRVKRICKAISDADKVHTEWHEELLQTLNLLHTPKQIFS